MNHIALTLATLLGLASVPALAQDLPEIADTDSNGIWSLPLTIPQNTPDLTRSHRNLA